MKPPTPAGPVLPPFCTLGPDLLPQAPPPGTPESEALAAWEVLTGARVARSTGSGRMSLLGKYRSEPRDLDWERILWIALHPFEGAEERWACRRARWPAMSDAQLASAIVQEMGGPAEEPDEMTTLGFWRGDVGFYFDCRGPSLVITELGKVERRIGRGTLLPAARRLLGIPPGAATDPGLHGTAPERPRCGDAPVDGEPPLQLSLL